MAFKYVGTGLLIGAAIIFQPELRKIFLKLGQARPFIYTQKNKHSHIEPVLIAAELLQSAQRNACCFYKKY